ncbi:putative integral membrane protein [Mycoplasmoides fastidiosum]|uniref:Integral membrane protein n=1 Tax=Mycoplasmoides fastidiosum TaxID=92758 RepID=A0ABU0LZD0_9BACT|nr:hypothetical protein [Mycoplasmoides fastidiosum]MDQ0514062.1 putative integral membrane protein [Mycoplasmoides fastidiosum]UUD37527.1 hypothetical protein NPA10_03090 [Mycoplasmoides fastidiosum]
MESNLKAKINNLFNEFHKKYWVSKTIYVVTNLAIMIMNVVFAILNTRAIQSNAESPLKWIFFTIALINICITFATGFKTLLALTNRVNKSKEQLEQLALIEENPDQYPRRKVVDRLTEMEATEY